MRRLNLVLLLVLLTGCYAGPNKEKGGPIEIGSAYGPTTAEAYMVRGVVRSTGMEGKEIADARISAFYRDKELANTTTDLRGRFFLRVYQDQKRSLFWIFPLPGVGSTMISGSSAASGVTPKNYAAIPSHGYWRLDLTTEAPGYAARRLHVDLPRNVNAPLVEILLHPLDS